MAAQQEFSRRLRLTKPAEFEAVMNYRCAVRTRYFQVMGRPNSLGYARLGMIVSKRLFSRSVDRNRMRRIIREAFRSAAGSLPSLDLVVRPHSRSEASATVEDLRAAFAGAAVKCDGC